MEVDGDTTVLETFETSGVIGEGIRISEISGKMLVAATWMITNAAGEVVLTSA